MAKQRIIRVARLLWVMMWISLMRSSAILSRYNGSNFERSHVLDSPSALLRLGLGLRGMHVDHVEEVVSEPFGFDLTKSMHLQQATGIRRKAFTQSHEGFV